MNQVDHFARQWLDWIIGASWQLALFVVLVTVACWIARKGSARLRHALWLLVLVKVFVSPALSASWSLGNVTALTSVKESLSVPLVTMNAELPPTTTTQQGAALKETNSLPVPSEQPLQQARSSATPEISIASWLVIIWLVGAFLFIAILIGRYRSLVRRLTSDKRIEEGPVRILLEELALELKLRQTPDLYGTAECSSPLLLGLFSPKIILPQSMCNELGTEQLRTILLHELIHHKHHDLWIGWVQVVAQALFWFHPLLWWANQKIRHERECVCDDAVLRQGRCTPESYGEAIVQVLTAARGRSLVTGNMVGVFERGNYLQNRMEEIMSYTANKKRFGWLSRATVLLFAVLFLPMAPQVVISEEVTTGGAVAEATAAPLQGQWPRVIATSPKIGETGVAISVNEISVTFDRDMAPGMSWTGGPPQFPPMDKSKEAGWKDKRTCVLPVKLSRGKVYRVGINSKSFNNFKGTDGQPALHTAIFFTTEGASRSMERQVQVPQIVEIEPANHAGDVDPKTRTIRVTFDMPMGGGMSWTGSGPTFPTTDASRKSRWSKNGRTCILPVTLEPGHTYKLGLNSPRHTNFQSKWGVPLVPVVYEFTTAAQSASHQPSMIEAEATSVAWIPPENPDPKVIFEEAEENVKAGRYEIASQKYVWFYENALRLDPSLSSERTSLIRSEWLDLGDVYPPMIEIMKQLRDEAEQRIRDSNRVRINTDDFADFVYLNQALREEQRTVEVFQWLDETEPRDAKRVIHYADGPLVRQKAYELYGKYIDPERNVDRMKDMFTQMEEGGVGNREIRLLLQERMFLERASTLVAILIQIDRESEAMEIAKELEDFLEDEKLKKKLHRQLESALLGEFPEMP